MLVYSCSTHNTMIMWMIILMITYCSSTKSYWIACALQTSKNKMFSFEYHDLHILVSISSCFWYEFHTEVLKHIFEKYTSAQFLLVFAQIQHNHYKKKYADIGIWTHKRNLHFNSSPLPWQLACEGTQPDQRNITFSSVFSSEFFTWLRKSH
jgi:hypothetical protein